MTRLSRQIAAHESIVQSRYSKVPDPTPFLTARVVRTKGSVRSCIAPRTPLVARRPGLVIAFVLLAPELDSANLQVGVDQDRHAGPHPADHEDLGFGERFDEHVE